MRARRIWLGQVLQIGAGIVAGLVGAAWFSGPTNGASSRAAAAATVDPALLSAEVRAQLATLPSYHPALVPAALTPTPAAAASAVVTSPAPPSREEATRVLKAEFERDFLAHAADARDNSWAPAAEASLAESLSNAPGSTYKVLSVDCKMTSCMATLRWPSSREAIANYHTAVDTFHKPNCESKILLHEPESDAPFEEKLLFNCAEARAE